MRSAPLLRLLLVLLFLALAACAQRPGSTPDLAPPVWGTVDVEVVNGHRADMAVYFSTAGSRRRLGTVTAGSRRTFEVRRVSAANLRDVLLVARAIGNQQEFTTDRLLVRPGQVIRLRLEDLLTSSSYSVADIEGTGGPPMPVP